MQYLVYGSGGPGFASKEEAVEILESLILPSFEALLDLEKQGKILAGGLPVADRAFAFILEAESNDEVDRLLRGLPMWGTLDWDVTPLQSFQARVDQEKDAVARARG